MHKILAVIRREFIERVRTRAFVISTILFPLLMTTLTVLPAILLRRTPLGRFFPDSRAVREHLMLDWDHAGARDVDWVLGAAMIVRRAAVQEIGPAVDVLQGSEDGDDLIAAVGVESDIGDDRAIEPELGVEGTAHRSAPRGFPG